MLDFEARGYNDPIRIEPWGGELKTDIEISGCDKCTFCYFVPGPASYCKYYRKGIAQPNNGKPDYCNVERITVIEAAP